MYWYDESKSIFVISHEKPYTWEDYYGMMGVVATMIEGITYPIVYLNEWLDIATMPQGNPIHHYRNMEGIFEPPAMILVLRDEKARHATRIFVSAIGRYVEGETFWFCDTFEDGLKLAQEQVERLRSDENDRTA